MLWLSIIIPVYNVEPYIERCIRSLLEQDIPKEDYEIICINDGSTDQSRDVIIQLMEEYRNIVLIDQQNKGVSAARNKGIDIACGEYLLMVDPDDFFKTNTLKRFREILNIIQPDICYTGQIIIKTDLKEEYIFDISADHNSILTGIEFYNTYFRGNEEIPLPHLSIGYFFRKTFLNVHNLRYLDDVPYLEDGHFMAKLNCLSVRTIFINEPAYNFYRRPGSATNSRLFYSEKARNGFLKAANDLFNFKMHYCWTEGQKKFMNEAIVQFTIVYLIAHGDFNYLKDYKEIQRNLKKGPLSKLDTEECSRFYKSMGTSYNFSIHCFYLTWLLHKVHKSIKMRIKKLLKENNGAIHFNK
jgi:glycosyltransferase involved in cell wall biosynthesis